MVTWVYDEIGCAGAILDEFCIRNLAGGTVGWIFGMSMFSLKGEHIGWFEDGVIYDIENSALGFVPGAKGLVLEMPALAEDPPMPPFSKRPYVPTLRGRSARPSGAGWSSCCLATYLEYRQIPSPCPGYIPQVSCRSHAAAGDLSL